METALTRAQRHGDNALIGGPVKLFFDGNGAETLLLYEQITGFQQEWNLANGRCVTANWLCSAKLMNTVGGFNQNLFSGGDNDCAGRLHKSGA